MNVAGRVGEFLSVPAGRLIYGVRGGGWRSGGREGGGGGAATLNEIDFLMKVCFLFAFQYEFEDQFCLNACVL